MKKLIIITLIIAMVLTGCNTPTDSNTTTKTHTITEYTTEGKETKLIPDETAMGELTISCYGYYIAEDPQNYYNVAVKMFNELYPNVKVNLDIPDINTVTYEQYVEKLSTEVMGGNGPDVFWMVGDPQDPYKMMESGALADLTPYIENDKGFNIDDFNKSVFYEGQLNGKQYFIPMDYILPLMLTTKEIVNQVGLDLSKCTDYISCAEEIARVVDENKLGFTKENIISNFTFPFLTPLYSGINWLDSENNKVDLSSPEIKKMFGFIKDSYMDSVNYYNPFERMNSTSLKSSYFLNKETMIADMQFNSLQNIITSSRVLYADGQTPVVFPWRNVNGKISAMSAKAVCVSQSSKNIGNAYRFIKVLISPELHAKFDLFDSEYFNVPINKNIAKAYLERESDYIYDVGLGKIDLKKLPQEFIDAYMGYINDVESATFDPLAGYTFRDIMKPYVDGEKTYEECIQEAQNKLDIYITE